jgi:hypothetical protein
MSLPNDYIDRDQQLVTMFAVSFGAMVFGGIHLTAWKFSFPSRADQVLWWSASIASTGLVSTILILPCHGKNITLASYYSYYSTLLALYDLDSVQISGCSLCYSSIDPLDGNLPHSLFLPPDAYVSTFAASIPHVG